MAQLEGRCGRLASQRMAAESLLRGHASIQHTDFADFVATPPQDFPAMGTG